MKYITASINYFLNFHKGLVNIVLHVIGFLGIFYSIAVLDWKMFTLFLVIVEVGHFYNHLAGIERYDFRPQVVFWRLVIFIAVILTFFLISKSIFDSNPGLIDKFNFA